MRTVCFPDSASLCSRISSRSRFRSSIIDRRLSGRAAAARQRVCMPIVPFSLKDAPSFIEHTFPAQRVSIEAQTERKAGAGQTLTPLGGYWKGRKPLVLVRACVLGSLLPATRNPEKDLEVFELLMAMDND